MELLNQYNDLLAGADDAPIDEIIAYLREELPFLWNEAYRNNCNRATDICSITFGTFVYIFDDCATLEAKGLIDSAVKYHARIIAAYGTSVQLNRRRDDYRLRGWLGKTNSYFGREWDKGHYIAHSIGGAVDQAELNVFKQRRDVNRGWSNEGKNFRKMETYCYNNPGIFCFHRPIYKDHTANPAFCEYGVLTLDKKLWVARFNNCI